MQRPLSLLPIALCLSLVGACSEPTAPVEILFEVRFDGAPIGCELSSESRALTDLRFYVHDLILTAKNGTRAPLELIPDPLWQSAEVALLDFEDGSGGCVNGTAPVNGSVRGTVDLSAEDGTKGLVFAIGVPEALNHEDPMSAAAPLNYTIMHWHWRSGYKFMRAGVRAADDLAWLHLGSSKCEGTIGDIKGCRAPNRPTVDLPDFDIATDRVIIDVARLFGPSVLGDGTPWDCQSGPDEEQCRFVFAELGLDFRSGETIGPAPIFFAERRR